MNLVRIPPQVTRLSPALTLLLAFALWFLLSRSLSLSLGALASSALEMCHHVSGGRTRSLALLSTRRVSEFFESEDGCRSVALGHSPFPSLQLGSSTAGLSMR